MYRPILRAKAGEFSSIDALSGDTARHIEPILEIPPRDFDFEKNQAKKTMTEHISGLSAKIKSSTFKHPTVFLDCSYVDCDMPTDDGRHCFIPLQEIFNEKLVSSVPVVHFSSPQTTIQAARESNSRYRCGVAVRLNSVAIRDVVNNPALLTQLCASLDTSIGKTDLVLDLGSVASEAATAELVASAVIAKIQPNEFRSITMVASSVPPDVSGVIPFQKTLMPRNEWQLWKNLRRIHPQISFGDYGTLSPGQSVTDMRNIVKTMRAKARYSCDAGWLLVAGTSYTEAPDQFFKIASILVSDAQFCGSDFSWGDAEIVKRAGQNATPGSLQTWVSLTTNHHLSFISNRLAIESST